MSIRPLYDRVLLKRKDPEEKSRAGLFLPSSAQEKSNLAVVVAVGSGRPDDKGELQPLKVEPGMTVLLSKWTGDEVDVGGVDHLIVREKDILAVMM